MSMYIVIGIVLAAALAIAVKAGAKKTKTVYSSDGIPEGLEEDYRAALSPGEDGIPLMYDLTTCRHCVHMHNFLDQHGIAHHQIFVDKFQNGARSAILTEMKKHNPRGSFPTLVIPGGKTVVGFREAQIREALGLSD